MNVTELAKEAGFSVQHVFEPPKPYVHIAGYGETLERFVAIVRAEALEEAAKLCDEDESGRDGGGYYAEIIRGLK